MNKVKIIVNTRDGANHFFQDKWSDEKLENFNKHLLQLKDGVSGLWLSNNLASDTESDITFFNPENIVAVRIIILK